MEAINLNLIPNGTNPVVHCSQYDEGREFRFNLFDGASVFVLDGTETISCDIKKPDGNIVTAAVPNTEDDYIIVTTTLQMCACSGNSLGSINISKGGINLYTLNFVLYCERSPLENGIESESSIHNLESMVDEMVAEDVATQYDSANVIFDNAPTSGHGTPYTVTSEGIKTAIDNAFDYDNMASGSLVHITDGADNIPVKSLVSQIVAVESGNGQPKSPDNPYTISGFNNAVITRCGKNLFDNSLMVNSLTTVVGDIVTLTATGNFQGSAFAFMPVKQGYKYALKIGSLTSGSAVEIRRYNASGTVTNTVVITQSTIININDGTTVKISIVYGNRTAGAGTFVLKGFNVALGEDYQSYEAYNGNTYTFAFGQTVYGGHFDNKGNLVVTHGIVDLGSLFYTRTTSYTNPFFYASIVDSKIDGAIVSSIYPNFMNTNSNYFGTNAPDKSISHANNSNQIFIRDDSYTDATAFKTAMSGVMLVYELATPITLSITSQDIPTLLGENNIFSNCGDLEVNYYTNKSNDILDFIDSEIGKKNGTNIPIEENSQDSIKDYIDDEVSTINTSLAEKADTNSVYAKTESFYCPQSHDFESGTTSSDAIIWFINTYGTKPMSFGFVITGLGWFECFLTFYSDSQGGGILLLNGSSRLWAVTYINGVITLTEK